MFDVDAFTFDQACNLTEDVLAIMMELLEENFLEFVD